MYPSLLLVLSMATELLYQIQFSKPDPLGCGKKKGNLHTDVSDHLEFILVETKVKY